MKEGGNYIPELNLTEDLVIKVIETPHPKYKRKGSDLIIEEKITLVEALCGVELKIEHLQGPLKVEIKEIVNPNQMFQELVLVKAPSFVWMPLKTKYFLEKWYEWFRPSIEQKRHEWSKLDSSTRILGFCQICPQRWLL